jgi:hypothetical protein
MIFGVDLKERCADQPVSVVTFVKNNFDTVYKIKLSFIVDHALK